MHSIRRGGVVKIRGHDGEVDAVAAERRLGVRQLCFVEDVAGSDGVLRRVEGRQDANLVEDLGASGNRVRHGFHDHGRVAVDAGCVGRETN